MKNRIFLNKKINLFSWLLILTLVILTTISILQYKIETSLFKYNNKELKRKIIFGKIVHKIEMPSVNYLLKTKDGIKIFLCSQNNDTEMYYGDKVLVECFIKDITLTDKYGLFLYNTYGVTKIGFVSNVIQQCNSDNTIYKIINNLYFISNRIRSYIVDLIKKNLFSPYDTILLRLTLGYNNLELKEIKNYFQDAGVAHVLVVSGLHISFVYIFIYFILKFIPWLNYKIKIILSVVFIIFYMFLTGCTTPVVRATIIISCIGISIILQRKHSSIHSLVLAAVIVLLVIPQSLFSPSFQLTFAACFGIFYFYKVLYSYLESFIQLQPLVLQNIIKLFLTTFSAQTMVTPLIMYYFNKYAVLSFISNIFVIPLTSLIVWIGILYYLFNFLFGNIHYIFWQVLQYIITVYLEIVKFFATRSFSIITVFTPSTMKILLYYFLILMLPIFVARKKLLRLLCLYILATVLLFININFVKELRITFLDVGIGDCILVTTKNGKNVIIDTAGGDTVAKYVITPYLLKNRIKNINYLIITHPHWHHYGATKYLFENFNIENIIVSNYIPSFYEYKDVVINTVKNTKTNFIIVKSTQVLNLDDVKIKIYPNYIYPHSDEILLADYNTLVVLVEHKNLNLVLSNDLPAEFAIKYFDNVSGKINIFQLPRHGKYLNDFLLLQKYLKQTNKFVFSVVNSDKIAYKNLLSVALFSTNNYGNIEIKFVHGNGKINKIQHFAEKTVIEL